MADLLISTEPSLVAYTQRVELLDNTYELRFYWNDRAQAWFVDIKDDAGFMLAAGRKCDAGIDLIEQYHHKDPMPPGLLVPWDTAQRFQNPLIDDFGTRVILLYLDSPT